MRKSEIIVPIVVCTIFPVLIPVFGGVLLLSALGSALSEEPRDEM